MSSQTLSKTDSKNLSFLLIGIAVIMAIVLFAMGRVWWCQAGDLLPWSFEVNSTHNSQHLFDPYALSHLQHGIGGFLLFALFGKWLTLKWRIGLIAILEAIWEIVENTPMIINRYREATISLDYYGDSIFNSLSDYAMCLLGIWIVRRIPWKLGLVLFVVLEITSLLWIKDSLTLNIIMLISPQDFIREWQAS